MTFWATWDLLFKAVTFLVWASINSILRRNKVFKQNFARFWKQFCTMNSLILLCKRWGNSFIKMLRMIEMTKTWNAKQDYGFQYNICNWLYYYTCGMNCWIVLHCVRYYVFYYVRFWWKRICDFSLNYLCTWIRKNEQNMVLSMILY